MTWGHVTGLDLMGPVLTVRFSASSSSSPSSSSLSGAMSREGPHQRAQSRPARSSTLDPAADRERSQLPTNHPRSEDLTHHPHPPQPPRPDSPSTRHKQPSATGHSEPSSQSESAVSKPVAAVAPPRYAHPGPIICSCSSSSFSSSCSSCGKPMQGPFVRALQTVFHLNCFKCMVGASNRTYRTPLIVLRTVVKLSQASFSQLTGPRESSFLSASVTISVVSISSVQNAAWHFGGATSRHAVR